MLQTHQLSTLDQHPELRDSMFQDRKKQFVDRLNWDIWSDEQGRELDSYDSDCATYIIRTNSNGDHLGSLRLTDCSKSCMLKEHFVNEFPDVRNFSKTELEITRFCISPKLRGSEAQTVSKQLINGAYFYALESNVSKSIVGLCYRPMLRVYRRANASPTSVFFGKNDGNLVMAKWRVSPQNFLDLITPPDRSALVTLTRKQSPQSENSEPA